jgi:predicted transglutaminase-like cysteine proteinase
MQGRSIMSIGVQIGRLFFLVAVCWSGAFADTHPIPVSSAVGSHATNTPDTQRGPESKSVILALPQLSSLAPNLINYGKDALLDPEEHGAKTPGIQTMLKNNSLNFALPQLAALAPNLLDPSKDALSSTEPFDLPTMTTSLGEMPEKWTELQSRILADEKALADCGSVNSRCSRAARHFLSILELGRKRHGRARLGWINRAVNLSIKPISDWVQYGHADFWASPLQTLSSGAGDCEDYAIVKYVALHHLGIALDDLRLLIVRDDSRQAVHAIVAVHYERKWLILDNRTFAMLDAEQSRHYYPLFVLDYRGARTFATVAVRR